MKRIRYRSARMLVGVALAGLLAVAGCASTARTASPGAQPSAIQETPTASPVVAGAGNSAERRRAPNAGVKADASTRLRPEARQSSPRVFQKTTSTHAHELRSARAEGEKGAKAAEAKDRDKASLNDEERREKTAGETLAPAAGKSENSDACTGCATPKKANPRVFQTPLTPDANAQYACAQPQVPLGEVWLDQTVKASWTVKNEGTADLMLRLRGG